MIEIGEYGRTNKGIIIKFAWLSFEDKRIKDKVILIENNKVTNNFYYFDRGESIVKHSKNIKDLIEKGDYVNGYLVVAISDDGYIEIAIGDDTEQGELLLEEDIKSILTKEQYAQNSYKVKEE